MMLLNPYRFGGTAPPSDTYEWWRIVVTANDGDANYISFAEMELFASADGTGTNYVLGRGAFASQTGDGAVGAASGACDGADSTEAGSSGAGALPGTPYVWTIQLASALPVGSMVLQSQRVVTGRTPVTFKLQGATSSGGTWVDVIDVAISAGWGLLERRVFPNA